MKIHLRAISCTKRPMSFVGRRSGSFWILSEAKDKDCINSIMLRVQPTNEFPFIHICLKIEIKKGHKNLILPQHKKEVNCAWKDFWKKKSLHFHLNPFQMYLIIFVFQSSKWCGLQKWKRGTQVELSFEMKFLFYSLKYLQLSFWEFLRPTIILFPFSNQLLIVSSVRYRKSRLLWIFRPCVWVLLAEA
jgi:hypothetical protein